MILEVISQDLTSDDTFCSVTDDFKDMCGGFGHLFCTICGDLGKSSVELKRIGNAKGMFSLYYLVSSYSNALNRFSFTSVYQEAHVFAKCH